MPKFEVAVHNQDVRRLVSDGQRHKSLTDDWADTHYVEIKAVSEQTARVRANAMYPRSQGYVIEHIVPLEDM